MLGGYTVIYACLDPHSTRDVTDVTGRVSLRVFQSGRA